jgi:hypothetical protein
LPVRSLCADALETVAGEDGHEVAILHAAWAQSTGR